MLITVIIPVYKVEQYLVECIESVISQTYKDIEIILVDDGSPDNCPIICDQYAEQYSNIRVIHKENGGLSSARNRGLEVSNGEYIVFLDSDDILVETAIEDIVMCLYSRPEVLITEMYNTKDFTIISKKTTFDIPDKKNKKDVIRFIFCNISYYSTIGTSSKFF